MLSHILHSPLQPADNSCLVTHKLLHMLSVLRQLQDGIGDQGSISQQVVIN